MRSMRPTSSYCPAICRANFPPTGNRAPIASCATSPRLPNGKPHADLLCDKLVQALTGIAAVTGTAESTATLSDAAILDLGSGIYAAAAVVAALRVRRKHGGGQNIDCSMYGTGINGLVTFLPFHFEGKVPPRGGNRHPMCAPWNAYEASDGWILLCSANDDQWKRLCRAMDRPELGLEGPLVKLADRVKRVDEVDAVVQGWTASRTVEDVVAALRTAEIASGPIAEVAELPLDPNVRHRNMVHQLDSPEQQRKYRHSRPAADLRQGRVANPEARWRPGTSFSVCRSKTHPANANTSQVMPLAGLRVLEIGQYTTAPLAAKHMASLGAEVIKIEPLTGEASRAWPPHLDGDSYFFTLNNTNKRSLALDLRSRGRSRRLHRPDQNVRRAGRKPQARFAGASRLFRQGVTHDQSEARLLRHLRLWRGFDLSRAARVRHGCSGHVRAHGPDPRRRRTDQDRHLDRRYRRRHDGTVLHPGDAGAARTCPVRAASSISRCRMSWCGSPIPPGRQAAARRMWCLPCRDGEVAVIADQGTIDACLKACRRRA